MNDRYMTRARSSARPIFGFSSVFTLIERMPTNALPIVTPLTPCSAICVMMNASASTVENSATSSRMMKFGCWKKPYQSSVPVTMRRRYGNTKM